MKENIGRLFTISKNISDKKFAFDQIKNLPAPVQRYFKFSLEEGQYYSSYVKLKHEGQFRQYENQKWMSIKGEEYFSGTTRIDMDRQNTIVALHLDNRVR